MRTPMYGPKFTSLRVLPSTPSLGDVLASAVGPANIDRYGRTIDYLRISITDRCNLRCVYCMPEEGVALAPKSELLSFEEIWRIAGAAKSIGFKKFRITGGEPLIVRDVLTFVRGLRQAVGDGVVALSTNGVRLAELAPKLKQAGVERINISLDTLDAERFVALSRRAHLREVLAGIDAAIEAGFARVKINAVIVRGVNDDEIVAIAQLAKTRPIDVRFIEQMPLDGYEDQGFLGAQHIIERLSSAFAITPIAPDDDRQAAQLMFSSPMLKGRVGVIAPRSQKFCAACNRMRLTPSGELKGCLLSEGTLDLRGIIRAGASDPELRHVLKYAIGIKPFEYKDAHYGLDRPMSAIGG